MWRVALGREGKLKLVGSLVSLLSRLAKRLDKTFSWKDGSESDGLCLPGTDLLPGAAVEELYPRTWCSPSLWLLHGAWLLP